MQTSYFIASWQVQPNSVSLYWIIVTPTNPTPPSQPTSPTHMHASSQLGGNGSSMIGNDVTCKFMLVNQDKFFLGWLLVAWVDQGWGVGLSGLGRWKDVDNSSSSGKLW